MGTGGGGEVPCAYKPCTGGAARLLVLGMGIDWLVTGECCPRLLVGVPLMYGECLAGAEGAVEGEG